MDFQETNGIQTGSGIKLVIYGQEGIGKSSLAAQLPGAVFLDCEGSTSKMNVRRLPKPTSWEMLQQELQFVLESHVQRQYQTVVIDTFDWAERLAIAQLCSKHNVNGIEGFGYGKGWEYEAEEIGRFWTAPNGSFRQASMSLCSAMQSPEKPLCRKLMQNMTTGN